MSSAARSRPIAVIDFETTGLYPAAGDRATEIAIVLLEADRVVDRFQSLMNAGRRLSPFIEDYTGITNAMVQAAPPAEAVMREAQRFVGEAPLVAHNASFDRAFWTAEVGRLGAEARTTPPFACTLLLARRLYPGAGSYKLGAMAAFHDLPSAGRAHRALADAEVAASLYGRICADLRQRYELDEVPHELLVKVQTQQRGRLPRVIQEHFASA